MLSPPLVVNLPQKFHQIAENSNKDRQEGDLYDLGAGGAPSIHSIENSQTMIGSLKLWLCVQKYFYSTTFIQNYGIYYDIMVAQITMGPCELEKGNPWCKT